MTRTKSGAAPCCGNGHSTMPARLLWLCFMPAIALAQIAPCSSGGQLQSFSISSSETFAGSTYLSATGVVTATGNTRVKFQAGTSLCFGAGFDFKSANGVSFDAAVAPLPSLTITTVSLPAGTQGQTYSSTLSGAGGTGNYSWSATGLPSGLSISTSGLIAGTPTVSGGSPYTVTVTLTDAATELTDTGMLLSVGKTFSLTINPPASNPVANPTFSPGGGTYASPPAVTISSTTAGASIRYTLDGTTPSETAGTLYGGPVTISTGATLKAIAYEAGFTDSAVTSASYNISSSLCNPTSGLGSKEYIHFAARVVAVEECPTPAKGAVQSASASASPSVPPNSTRTLNVSVTFPSSNTAGNTIIVTVAGHVPVAGSSITQPVLTDSLGNTYNQVFWVNSCNQCGPAIGMFVARNVNGGANTLTFSYSAFNAQIYFAYNFPISIAVAEISGMGTPNTQASNEIQTYITQGGLPITLTDSGGTAVTSEYTGQWSDVSFGVADLFGGGTNFFVACLATWSSSPGLPTVLPGSYMTYHQQEAPESPDGFYLYLFVRGS